MQTMKNQKICRSLQFNLITEKRCNLQSAGISVSKNNIKQQLNNKYYQCFIFTDNITNNMMAINSMPTSGKTSQNDCHRLLKQTHKFHIDSIKNRNYKPSRHTDPSHNFNKQTIFVQQKQKLKKYFQRKKQQQINFIKQKYSLHKLLNKNINQSNNNTCSNQTTINQINVKQTTNITQQQPLKLNQKLSPNNISYQSINSNKETNQNQKENQSDFNQIRNFQLTKPFNMKSTNKFNKNKKNYKLYRIQKTFIEKQQKSKSQQQLLKKLEAQIHCEVSKHADFLITPKSFTKVTLSNKINKRNIINREYKSQKNSFKNHYSLLNKLNSSSFESNHTEPLKYLEFAHLTNKKQETNASDVSKFQFNQQNNEQIYNKYCIKEKSSNSSKSFTNEQQNKNKQQHKIIEYIKQGNYFRIQIQLSLQRKLLFIHEKITNNNLLHLSILHNQLDIFWMILSKLGEEKTKLLNEPNRYFKTPFQLAKVYKIIKKNDSLYDILQNPRLLKFQL